MAKASPQPSVREVNTGSVLKMALLLGYARVSTLNEEQQSSIENQVERLRSHGCHKVWVETYTGTEFEKRPELNKLLDHARDHVKSQLIEVVVCDFNRLGRGLDRPLIIKRLAKLGITVRSLSEGIRDLNTPHDELVENVMASVDGFYAAEVRYKVRRSKVEARAQHKPLGNQAPFGYRWSADKSKYEPDPKTWAIAKELVQQFLSGKGQKVLVVWLREKYGINRSTNGIYTWLKSPVLRGHLKYRISENGEKRTEFAYNTHKPLISPAEDRAIQLRFEINKAHPPGKTEQPIYAISGLLFCETCGTGMHRGQDRKGYISYRCRGKIWQGRGCPHSGVVGGKRAEPLILEAICSYAEEIAKAVSKQDDAIQDPQILEREAELAEMQAILKRNHRKQIQQAIEEVEREISLLRSQDQDSQKFRAERQEMIMALANPNFWQGLSEQERNTIYRDLKVRMWCRGREIIRVDIGP